MSSNKEKKQRNKSDKIKLITQTFSEKTKIKIYIVFVKTWKFSILGHFGTVWTEF